MAAKHKLNIYLRNGQVIVIRCTEYKWTHAGGRLTGYQLKNASKHVWVSVEDIVAIQEA